MNLDSISFFRLASQRMHWLGARQQVISENVANADTPGYKAREVGSFADLAGAQRSTSIATTNPQHITSGDASGVRVERDRESWGTSASGNTVVLEQQTIKANETSESYRLAAQLYRKGHDLLSLAVTGGR